MAKANTETPPTKELPRGLVVLIAVATGAVVANLYYAQPVLHQVAGTFHSGPGPTSTIITATQIGYAAGLLLVVPLGDLHPRRGLVTRLFCLSAVALIGCALAPDLWIFAVASILVGAASVAGQVMIPFAADLAPEERRGRVVARIMTGLLLGILLARTVSGLIAGVASGRVVYGAAAVVMVARALVLGRVLPVEGERPAIGYGTLLRSTLALFLAERLLRRRILFGALGMAAFSVFWTTMAFVLSAAPYHYGDAAIGLFGLVGAAGAICAPFIGRLADRYGARRNVLVALLVTVVSFVVLYLFGKHMGGLIAGVILLDIGVQAGHVSNQTRIYGLLPEARSRLNMVYMICYFTAGAIGSFAGSVLWHHFGWAGVCGLGCALSLAGCGVYALTRPRDR